MYGRRVLLEFSQNENALDAFKEIFTFKDLLKLKIEDVIIDDDSQTPKMAMHGGINEASISRLYPLIELGSNISIILSYRFDSNGGVFETVNDFYHFIAEAKDPKTPESFYILDRTIGKLEGNSNDNNFIESLEKFVSFVKYISSLAHYHDEKSSKNAKKFIFVSNKNKPIEIEVLLNDEIMGYISTMNLSLLKELYEERDQKAVLKQKEKKSIFYSSLSEFCGGSSSPSSVFSKIITEWIEFENLYLNNFSAYLNDFKLDKLKKELAESELTFSSNISEVINDSVTKLLAVSASIAAIALLRRFSFPSFDEGKWLAIVSISVFILGLGLSSWLVSKIILAQKDKLDSVKRAKGILFSVLQNKERDVSELARVELSEVTGYLDTKLTSAEKSLNLFSRLSYLPVVIYCLALMIAYGGPIIFDPNNTTDLSNSTDSSYYQACERVH